MLRILIHNDRTGTDESANYDCSVFVNEREIWRGRVEGHNRSAPWHALVMRMVLEGVARENDPALLAALDSDLGPLDEFAAGIVERVKS